MEIKKRDILKAGVELAVGAGVGIIATNAINMVTPHNLSKVKKISVRIGSFALVWMISSAASEHINKVIDGVADGLQAGRNLSMAKSEQFSDEAVAYLQKDADATSKLFKDPSEPIASTLEELDFPEEGVDEGGR